MFNFLITSSRLAFVIGILLSLSNCTSSDSRQNKALAPDPYWNRLAKLFSGRIIPSGLSPAKEAIFIQHNKEMNLIWESAENQILNPIQKFRNENPEFLFQVDTAFYPFSGADLINFFSFYPDSKSYYMFGLENQGTILDPETIDETKLKRGFRSLQILTGSLAKRNYFTYKIMREEMANPIFGGVTPTLLALISRFGFEIQSVQIVEDGVDIAFFRPEDRIQKTLSFRKIFIRNDFAKSATPQAEWLRNIPKNRGILTKSAEYLLHGDRFSDIRDLLLQDTIYFLQDDSGVPIRVFPENEWIGFFHGIHSRSFLLSGAGTPENQPTLKEKFQGKTPLPFDFGYGVLDGKNKSSLMLFKRIQQKR